MDDTDDPQYVEALNSIMFRFLKPNPSSSSSTSLSQTSHLSQLAQIRDRHQAKETKEIDIIEQDKMAMKQSPTPYFFPNSDNHLTVPHGDWRSNPFEVLRRQGKSFPSSSTSRLSSISEPSQTPLTSWTSFSQSSPFDGDNNGDNDATFLPPPPPPPSSKLCSTSNNHSFRMPNLEVIASMSKVPHVKAVDNH